MKLKPLAAIAAAIACAIVPATALAAPPTPTPTPTSPPTTATVWVAPAPTPVSTLDNSCTHPGYNTIQSAINAVPAGATINICAGTYVEQLQITQAVTLTGHGAVTVKLPATPADATTACDAASNAAQSPTDGLDQDGISICGTGTVTITDVTLDAAWPVGTCNNNLYGILVGGGATLYLSNSSVTAAGAVPLNGCQGGVAIQVGMAWTTPNQVGKAELVDDHVSGYQKNGITADGSGSEADIIDTTVTGIGPTTAIAQNGIQVSNGAYGAIANSTITGNECNYPSVCGLNGSQAAGVLFYGAADGSYVSGSKITNNDYGVYSYDADALAPTSPSVVVEEDTISSRYEGVILDQGFTEIDATTISGGAIGLDVYQYDGQSYAADGTAFNDTIKGASVAAIDVQSDDAPSGDFPGQLTVEYSTLKGNAAKVLNNSTNYKVVQLGDN